MPVKDTTDKEAFTTKRVDQVRRLTAAAPTWLRPAINSMPSTLLTGSGSEATAPAPQVVPESVQIVDRALSSCGLTIRIFRSSATATPAEVPTTTLDPASAEFCTGQELPVAPEYVGLTVDQANTLAEQRSEHIRILVQDGKSFPALADRGPHRIDVAVKGDRIVQACTEQRPQ